VPPFAVFEGCDTQHREQPSAPSFRVLSKGLAGWDDAIAESGFVFGMPTLLKSGKDTRPKTVPKHAFLPKIYKNKSPQAVL